MAGPSLRVAASVKWIGYADGVVAYVPATCETHLLSPEFELVFNVGSVIASADALHLSLITVGSDAKSGPQAVALSANACDELLNLQILEPAH